jgi:hypothetical protein
MKFSRVINRVRWFSLVETNVSRTISVLVLRVIEIIIPCECEKVFVGQTGRSIESRCKE